MGPSGKWIKSLVGLKSPSAGKATRWSRLWRSASSGAGNESPSSFANAFSSVVAAVVRAPHKDFRVIRAEWAAVRIQTAFRASMALRSIVQLQALVRGRLVRRQLAATIKGLQALLRAGSSADRRVSEGCRATCRLEVFVECLVANARWCNSQGSLNEVRSKIYMRHEGAVKRERAIAYALSHQPRSSKYSGRSKPSSSTTSTLESYIPSPSSVTSASATNSSASDARSDSVHGGGLSYMSLTKSAKARFNGFTCNNERGKFQIQRQRSANMTYHQRVALSSLDAESNAGSEISVTSRKLNSMSLNGPSMTSSFDKENAG